MTADACEAGEPPAIPPSCRSCTGTATRPFRYGNVASACVTSDASYRDTHVPSGSLLVTTLRNTEVSSLPKRSVLKPASAKMRAIEVWIFS